VASLGGGGLSLGVEEVRNLSVGRNSGIKGGENGQSVTVERI